MTKEIYSVQTDADEGKEFRSIEDLQFYGTYEECEAYCKESSIEHGYIVNLAVDGYGRVVDGLEIYEF